MSDLNVLLTDLTSDDLYIRSSARVAITSHIDALKNQVEQMTADREYCLQEAKRHRKRAEASEAALTTANERVRVLEDALASIKWKSIDRDNMEFEARITYVQMDNIRAALKWIEEKHVPREVLAAAKEPKS